MSRVLLPESHPLADALRDHGRLLTGVLAAMMALAWFVISYSMALHSVEVRLLRPFT